ncbi:MAG: DUF4339 domain-containing protein [Chitinophagaceae bacterium]
MKKYFLNDGGSQQGPFDLEELRAKNITAATPIWYEGLAGWTTAGKVEELKEFFAAPLVAATPTEPAEAAKPVTPAVASSTTTSTSSTVKTVAQPVKKSSAWVSWVLGLLVLGGVGFLIYQDMEKNKTASSSMQTAATSDTTATSTDIPATTTTPQDATPADTVTSLANTTTSTDTTSTDPTTTTVTTTTTPTTTKTTTSTAQQIAAQKAAAKKIEDEKKKKLAAAEAAKKAEADKKQKAALAAKELEMRNNWPKYVSFGKLNYDTKGDGISAFDVPVYNNTDAVLDKVTIRVDYMKKENKAVKSETIVIYGIPAHAGLNGKAPESKKGEKVNVYITAISSKGLHFCYPQNNGNPSDPYFCN